MPSLRLPEWPASGWLGRVAPGLPPLLRYRFAADFRHDFVAGLSVASVAVPVAIAYAELAGFNPVIGLYSSILPLVAYAIFGTSRQLMVNPDAATCAMVAAAVAPLAGGDSALYLSLAVTLTFFAGLICIVASFCRLGAMADFLSKPILVGFLNGIAISIFLGQASKLLGFPVESGRIFPRLFEIARKLPETHVPTFAMGLGCFAVLAASLRWLPRIPAALVVMIVAGALTAAFGLEGQGIATLQRLPAGFPALQWPAIPLDDIEPIAAAATALALVLFTSGTLTARSFAAKGGYDIDVDREFAAYGAANIAAALSQGFAVTGADSRTAMAVAAGGRTQVTGLVAAVAIAVVLVFLSGPLHYVPIAALGAVLVFAAIALFDLRTLRELWTYDKIEVGLSVITMLGVAAVGAINGIVIAVALALARFIRQVARPRAEVLGTVEGMRGFHSVDRHRSAQTTPRLTIFRFNAPLTFFNADYFKQRALAAVAAAGPGLRWFVIDAIPISDIDISGLYAVRDLRTALDARGVTLIFAGRRTEFLNWLREIGAYRADHETRVYPTLRQAVKACLREEARAAVPAVGQ